MRAFPGGVELQSWSRAAGCQVAPGVSLSKAFALGISPHERPAVCEGVFLVSRMDILATPPDRAFFCGLQLLLVFTDPVSAAKQFPSLYRQLFCSKLLCVCLLCAVMTKTTKYLYNYKTSLPALDLTA